MTDNSAKRRRLCTICARGGSEGVPGKNTKSVGGLPLIAHSIARAKEAGIFEFVVVDSDSQAILDVAAEFGADLCLLRPPDLATSTAPKLAVIHRAAREAEAATGVRFDTFVDLDATSPLRIVADITGAVDLLESTDAANVITGTPAHRSPYFNLVEIDESGNVGLSKPSPVGRRQDSPPCFDMNASVYVWRREPFVSRPFLFGPSTKLFSMPRERSIDIDEPLDLRIVEMLMEEST